MRQALAIDALTAIYGGLAQRYDWQHRLITFASDQRGRRLLVERTVREGDRVLARHLPFASLARGQRKRG